MNDQERVRYEKIPESLRDIFQQLEEELIQLCFRWKLYCQLYRKSELRIDLLNATAPELFHHLQFIQLNDVVLGICRLTDPVKSGSNTNLVLRQLLELDSNSIDSNVVERLSCELDAADSLVSHFRKIRHKKIAHLDL